MEGDRISWADFTEYSLESGAGGSECGQSSLAVSSDIDIDGPSGVSKLAA
jgi:hypothetical protein